MTVRVLLIEADPDLREMIRDSLEQAGYAVASVASAYDASRLLDAGAEPDAFVVDLWDAADVLAQIRANPNTASLPIVGIVETDSRRALPAGVTTFLPMPFEIEDLARALRAATNSQPSATM